MPRTRVFGAESRQLASKRRAKRKSNPESASLERLTSVPSLGAVLRRARTPYKKRPLSEDEALNLVCDARQGEPTYPIEKLLKKFRR